MTTKTPLAVAYVCAVGALALAEQRFLGDGREVTFSRDVAPIVLRRCAPCHRPGEVGPFSLLTYRDVADHAHQIEEVTRTRFMPPWKAVPGSVSYANDRSLTSAEIRTIRRWVEQGARPGDPAAAPPLPVWPQGWQLGSPDVVVRLPEAYTLAPEGRDVYRNFVIPAAVIGPHWVAAWEFRSEGASAIHHAILNVDRRGWARQRDALEPGPGYGGMDPGDVQSPDGFYLVWTPGKTPTPPSPGTAWRVDEHTDLVLQLHMQPSGRRQIVNPAIGLFFTATPPTQTRFTVRIGDRPIDIAAGDSRYVVSDAYELPADVDLLGLFPHAHYLATVMRAWAMLPDGRRQTLLAIDDWDFNWQEEYVFAHPLVLPKGTRIGMQFTYDNSAANVRNPNHPPRRVKGGERSIDEMGNITLQMAPHDARDLEALRESKYRRLVGQGADARRLFNLGNALGRQGKIAEAMGQYRAAIVADPAFVPARFNLGNLLLGAGKPDEAAVAFERALELQPDMTAARTNLGHALLALGRTGDAIGHLRAAVAADPRSAAAHASLALALARATDATGAIHELQSALALEPDNAAAHVELADLLRAAARRDEAVAHYRRALQLEPALAPARRALDEMSAQP